MSDGWRERAACKGEDTETFYPMGRSLSDEQRKRESKKTVQAKAICVKCPVKTECLEYGLKYEPVYGIFGELTAGERKRLRARRNGLRVKPLGRRPKGA